MTEPESAPAEKPPKKKRRKKALPDGGAALRPALDGHGRERPVFLLSFPAHTELDRLVAAFERGDYATVRSDAPRLAEATDRADVRAAANELRKRIDPDPLMKLMLGMSALLLAFLVVWTYFLREP